MKRHIWGGGGRGGGGKMARWRKRQREGRGREREGLWAGAGYHSSRSLIPPDRGPPPPPREGPIEGHNRSIRPALEFWSVRCDSLLNVRGLQIWEGGATAYVTQRQCALVGICEIIETSMTRFSYYYYCVPSSPRSISCFSQCYLKYVLRILSQTDKSYHCTWFDLLHRAGRVLNESPGEPLENIIVIGRQSKEMDFFHPILSKDYLSALIPPSHSQDLKWNVHPEKSGFQRWEATKWNQPSLKCESDWGQWRKLSYLLHRQTNLSLSRPFLPTNSCAATLWDFL